MVEGERVRLPDGSTGKVRRIYPSWRHGRYSWEGEAAIALDSEQHKKYRGPLRLYSLSRLTVIGPDV